MPSREKRIEIRLFTTEKAAAIWSGLYLTLGGSSLQKKKKRKGKARTQQLILKSVKGK